MSNATGANTEARDIYPSETPDFTYWVIDVQSVLCRPSCVCSSFYISQIITPSFRGVIDSGVLFMTASEV
jgi:hypothetical protein